MMQKLVHGKKDMDALIAYCPIVGEKESPEVIKPGEIVVYPNFAALEFDKYVLSLKNMLERLKQRPAEDVFGARLADQIESEILFCERPDIKKMNKRTFTSEDEANIPQYSLPTMTLDEMLDISRKDLAIVEVEHAEDPEVCIEKTNAAIINYFGRRLSVIRLRESSRWN